MSTSSSNRSAGGLFDRAFSQYLALPRAGRWLALAVIGFGGFTVLDSWAWPLADKLSSRADRLEKVLQRASARAEGLPRDVREAAVAFGPNAVLGDEASGKERLTSLIAEVFKKRNVSQGQDVRPGQPLPATVAQSLGSISDAKLGKTVAELQFKATPDAVLAIIAELESSPEVDAIGDIRLDYDPKDKRVGVQMSVEKWGFLTGVSGGGA
jgi:hypothetical protein